MKKVVLPGLMAGVVMLVVGMIISQVFGFVFPSLRAEYNNPGLFRPWSDPLMWLMFVEPFVLGIILALFWDRTKRLFREKQACKRGVRFGLVYWLITIPGMIMSYSSFPISLIMILSWSVSILGQSVCAGMILAKMNK